MLRGAFLCLFCIHVCQGGLFSWLFESYEKASHSQNKEDKTLPLDDSALAINVPFEMTIADEKFISEVSSMTSIELSQLDICHHRVILSLKSTCSEMSEEELAKVAVNLLNCQSAIEGRLTYPCSNEMTIQECTHNMDLSTWNAYHIVSNRARAVCYQFRQQQFKAKTELTINKLMHSAMDQIDAMKQLENSQSTLQETTIETFRNLNTGHELLIHHQEQLSKSQHSIQSYVTSNLRELYKEKRLIALGQKELAHITESIKKNLNEAQKQLREQGVDQHDSHEKILFDLASIQENARRVGQQLDDSTVKILKTHEQTIQFYQHLMDDLQQMNQTVYHLMSLVRTMRIKFEERFSWISHLLGDTDETLQRIYLFIVHICYFFIAMVGAGFLKIPYPSRIFLFVFVPLNALFELNYGLSFHFYSTTTILCCFLIINLSFKHIKHFLSKFASRFYKKQQTMVKRNEIKDFPTFGASSRDRLLGEATLARKRVDELLKSKSPCSNVNIYLSPRQNSERAIQNSVERTTVRNNLEYPLSPLTESSLAGVRQRLISKLSEDRVNPEPDSFSSLNDTDFTSPSTPKNRKSTGLKCTALCKNGLPCRNAPTPSSKLCFRHLKNLSRESTPVS